MSDKISEFMQKYPFVDKYLEHLIMFLIGIALIGLIGLPVVLAFWLKSAWLLLLYILIIPLFTAFVSEDWEGGKLDWLLKT